MRGNVRRKSVVSQTDLEKIQGKINEFYSKVKLIEICIIKGGRELIADGGIWQMIGIEFEYNNRSNKDENEIILKNFNGVWKIADLSM